MTRQFDTGANRDTDEGKLDFEGFLSPRVLKEFAEYMHANRHLPNGEFRDSDNWQKGIPQDVYMKSAWRHFFDVWAHHRGLHELAEEDLNKAICGVMFNIMGYFHEELKITK